MRTSVDIEDGLMEEAMRATGLKTKKEVVEAGLQALVRVGKDLDALRAARERRAIYEARRASSTNPRADE